MKAYIEMLAHRRRQEFPLAIWNGVNAANFHFNPMQCPVQKRGDNPRPASACNAPDKDPPSPSSSATVGVSSAKPEASNTAGQAPLKPSSSSITPKTTSARPSNTGLTLPALVSGLFHSFQATNSGHLTRTGPAATTAPDTTSKADNAPTPLAPTPTQAIKIMLAIDNRKGIVLARYIVHSYQPSGAPSFDPCRDGFWPFSAPPTVKTTDIPTHIGPFTTGSPSGCVYSGPSTGVGSISCSGMRVPSSCTRATLPSQTNCVNNAGNIGRFYPQVVCAW